MPVGAAVLGRLATGAAAFGILSGNAYIRATVTKPALVRSNRR